MDNKTLFNEYDDALDTAGQGAVVANSLKKGLYVAVRGGKHPIMKLLRSKHYGIIDIGGIVFPKAKSRPMVLHVTAGDGKMVYVKNPLGMKASIRLQTLPADQVWTVIGKVKNPNCVKKAMLKSLDQEYSYHALFNNCEHFVSKVLSGKKKSRESLRVYGIGSISLLAFGAGIMKFMKGIRKESNKMDKIDVIRYRFHNHLLDSGYDLSVKTNREEPDPEVDPDHDEIEDQEDDDLYFGYKPKDLSRQGYRDYYFGKDFQRGVDKIKKIAGDFFYRKHPTKPGEKVKVRKSQ